MRAGVFTLCEYGGCNCPLYLRRVGRKWQVTEPSQAEGDAEGVLCVKGRQIGDLYRSDRRITAPRVFRGGRQRVVSRAEAIDAAAQGLKEYTPSHTGSLGVLCSGRLTNEQALVLGEFAEQVLGTRNIDNLGRARDGAAIWGIENALLEHYRRPRLRSIQDSDTVIVLNSNLPYLSPLAATMVLRARERGATVIVMDEVATDIADESDILLTPRPGTFHAALVQLAAAIAEGDLFEDMAADAAQATGIAHDRIQQVAEALKNAGRPSIVASTIALSRPQEGYLAAMLARSLADSSEEAARILCVVASVPNTRGVTLMGVWPIDGDGVRRGYSAELMMRGSLDALLAVDAPLEVHTGFEGIERLRDSLEFLCVIAPYESETAAIADVVLPMDTWHVDGGTITGGGEGVWVVGGGADTDPQYPLTGSLSDLAQAIGERLPDVDISSVRQRIKRATFAGFGDINWDDLKRGEPLPLGAGYSPVAAADRDAFLEGAADALHPLGDSEEFPLTIHVRHDEGYGAHAPRVCAAPILEAKLRQYREAYVTVSPDTARRIGADSGKTIRLQTRFGKAQPKLRTADGIPTDLILVPWHCRDLVFTLCGPGNIDDVTGVLSHPPVAAAIESAREGDN